MTGQPSPRRPQTSNRSRWRHRISHLAVTTIATAALPFSPAAAHAAAPVAIGPGTGILSLHGVPLQSASYSYACTLTAIGHDDTGALIGITNAHCFYDNVGDQWLYDAIYLEQPGLPGYIDSTTGPIGHVVLIGPGNPVVPGPSGMGLDYAVIAFDPAKVTPARAAGITTVGPPPPPGSPVCKHGNRTGLTCGIVLARTPPYFTTTLTEDPGDSGAPVTFGDILIGTQWIAFVATSMAAILDELAQGTGPGAGFRLATT